MWGHFIIPRQSKQISWLVCSRRSALHWNSQWSKEVTMQGVKEAINRFKKQNRPVKERQQAQQHHTSWNTTKVKVDDPRIFSWLRKFPSKHPSKSRIVKEGGVLLSMSTIKKWLHKCEYSGFTIRCKPLIARLDSLPVYIQKKRIHITSPVKHEDWMLFACMASSVTVLLVCLLMIVNGLYLCSALLSS